MEEILQMANPNLDYMDTLRDNIDMSVFPGWWLHINRHEANSDKTEPCPVLPFTQPYCDRIHILCSSRIPNAVEDERGRGSG